MSVDRTQLSTRWLACRGLVAWAMNKTESLRLCLCYQLYLSRDRTRVFTSSLKYRVSSMGHGWNSISVMSSGVGGESNHGTAHSYWITRGQVRTRQPCSPLGRNHCQLVAQFDLNNFWWTLLWSRNYFDENQDDGLHHPLETKKRAMYRKGN
jgi:hypothetical protein